MADEKRTPDELDAELKKAQARIAILEQQNRAQTEGKDQTGTYGWTNLPQDDADALRLQKKGRRFISQAERNRADEAWSARGGDQVAPPPSNTIERDAQTGKVLSAPDNAPARELADHTPRAPVETVNAPDEEVTII